MRKDIGGSIFIRMWWTLCAPSFITAHFSLSLEFLTIINRLGLSVLRTGQTAKQTFPHYELLILPLLLQATTQCTLGFVVTCVPVQKHNQPYKSGCLQLNIVPGPHTFYPSLEVTPTHSYHWGPTNMDTASRRLNTTYQASGQSPVPPLPLSRFQMHSAGWRDSFCLHVSVLLQHVWHAWYGTLNGSWKASLLTGCRFGPNCSQGIVCIIQNRG